MRTSHKTALTILISLILTGAFAALAYTGLFRVLETDFFSERVKSDQLARLEDIGTSVGAWNDAVLSRFDAIARDRNFQAAYSVNQRPEEIEERGRSVDALQDRLIGFRGLRIVGADGRIEYSSYADDITREETGESRLYRNWDQIDDPWDLPSIGDESTPQIVFDGGRQTLFFLIPSDDRSFVVRGWMVVEMGVEGLAARLSGDGFSTAGSRIHVVDGRGLITNIRPEQVAAVETDIDVLWPIDGEPAEFAMLARDATDAFWLLGTVAEDGTWVGRAVPGRLFGFSPLVQALIILTVFIVLCLIVFLLFNIRPDRTEIIKRRVNKLQVNLLRDWLEHHEGRKLRLSDLESRRDEVRSELRTGLGTLKADDRKLADEIIDDGWTRIIEILAEKDIEQPSSKDGDAAGETTAPAIDMQQLEDMITRAVASAKIVVPQEALSGLQVPAAAAPIAPAPGRPISVEVEDEAPRGEPVEVEELEELEELEDLEDLDEVEEIESLEEKPEGAAAAVTPRGEPVEVEELEELEDLDEVEEIESLEEDEPERAEAAEAPSGEPVEVEELEELEDLDEVEEIESLEDEPEGAAPTEEPAFEDLVEVPAQAPVLHETPDRHESVRDAESADNLEELEIVEEPEPLAPERTEEEVLEVLPVVLSEDSRELIEIDKVDQDRLYMFEKEFNKPRDSQEEPEELEVEELEELDEFDEPEELDELDEIGPEGPLEGAGRDVVFISVAEILETVKSAEIEAVETAFDEAEEETSMESLVMTRTSGILPGMESLDEEFSFDEGTPVLAWSESGLDYDRYLKGFKKGATGIYKSLMSLSKDFNAICGVLLAGSRKGLETDYAVGLDDESATYLSASKTEPVWDEWFRERDVVFVPDLSTSFYAEKTSHNEFRYIRSALFLPAVYHGAPSYIFLGFKDSPADPMAILMPREAAK